MNKSVFDFGETNQYLRYRLQQFRPQRGAKKQLSDYLRIQPAYLSQILAGKHSLTFEQADALNTFWLHSEEESQFFLLLVGKERAGTVSLKQYYKKEILKILQKRQNVVDRLGRKAEINPEAKGIYYSSWIYSAIHIALTIPELREIRKLADYLDLSLEKVRKVLEFLEQQGLIKKEGLHFLPTENWVRLERGSPHLISHHSQWRNKIIESLERESESDLHFTGVYSMDKLTAQKIKNQILDLMKEHMKEIQMAPEENLYVLATDFFNLKNNG